MALAAAGQAHEPITTKLTWTQEISRIVYRRCVSCHREGGQAPMSLLTYEQARPWAKAIKEEVLERRMPPWDAVKGFGEFRDDRSLSDVEITWLAEWVEGGAPQGDEIYLPAVPSFERAGAKRPPRATKVPLTGVTRLPRDVIAVGIEPRAAVAATARRPDGTVAPLIWVRERRKHAPGAYYFREPMKLPKGAEIRVTAADSSPASLLIAAARPAR